jgi:4-hydroxybutyrate dehydrogenase
MMQEFMVKPTIMTFDTCKKFAEDFHIGEGDVLITNRFIYDPLFKPLNLKCAVLLKGKYGETEPSDLMAEAMYNE